MIEETINLNNIEHVMNLFGSYDQNIKIIETEYNVSIINRDNSLRITGESKDVEKAVNVLKGLIDVAKTGDAITRQNVNYFIQIINDNNGKKNNKSPINCICITAKGKQIKSKTFGQQKYVDSIKKNIITIAIGPAGTGKTYLAVALAVNAFRQGQVSRIILTRPAVEAGENLGFLPGDLQTKIDPYLRPLYDALYDTMGTETFYKHFENGSIEVAPLAYMRGRTLDDAFIILDEAQNTTSQQMKMFLTRIGFGSKVVVNGDITQIDLPKYTPSGLKEIVEILNDVEGIEFINLTGKDVVRHELIQKIIKAYEKYENSEGEEDEKL